MRIGVISDVHDHLHHLQPALSFLSGETEVLICCGDLCSPFVMDELHKYAGPVHIVFGNNDADLFRITRKASGRVQVYGEFLEIELGGLRIAANHFDNIALPVAKSQMYDLVCFGHIHRFSLNRYERTTALNPGALMGSAFGPNGWERVPATFAIFDTSNGKAELFRVDGSECRMHEFRTPTP